MFGKLTVAGAAALLCACAGENALRVERVAADTPASSAAQRAYVDPRTGKLTTRPTGPRAYDAPTSAAEAALPLRRTAEGYEFLDMSQYRMTTRAVREPDGTLSFRCLHPHTEAPPAHEDGGTLPTRQL